MKKSIFIILLILIIPINTFSLTYPTLHYQNAIVYDLTDQKVLYELNSEKKSSIASLTKLMTIITAIENISDFNQTITYTTNMKKNVAWYASVAGFKVGDKLTIYDLLYAAMLPSGADATVALAISTSGTIPDFVEKMNQMAEKIGMTNSNFVNVHGLDEENHYSTAKDIQLLLQYALQNEIFKKVYTTKTYTLSTGKFIKSTVQKQADSYGLDLNKIVGSKTGFTGDAGLCISVLMQHQAHEILFITLNAPTSQGLPFNISDSVALIDFIENNYNYHKLISNKTIVKTLPVENSKIESYTIKTSKEISLFLENDYNKEDIIVKYNGLNKLSYKNKVGDKIGTINYYYKDTKIEQETVYLTTNIKPSIFKIIKSNLFSIILTIMATLFMIIALKKAKKRKRRKKKRTYKS